jgi:hypothetical protein
VALAAAALAAGCGHTGINSPEGWNRVQTKHFTLYTSTSQLYSETLVGLEYHYASFSSSFFKHVDIGKVDVLFLEADDFGELFGYKRGFATLARMPRGGPIGKEGLIVVKDATSDNASAEALAHVFVHRGIPNAPLWFHEGFSSYARYVEYKEGGGQRMTCFGQPAIDDLPFIPLSKLFQMSWDDYDGAEARSWYKQTARTLVDFMLHGERGKRIESLNVVVAGFTAGKATPEIIPVAFKDLDLDALNKKVVEHGTDVLHQAASATKVRGLCPIGFEIRQDVLPDLGERTLEDVPPDQIKALLDGLKRLPRRDDGYPGWYPEEIVARVEAGGAKP